eukprot:m.77323 g.77323  ORF g.77323 m.77323 type:complete len:89 (+) comp36019_c0_seq6:13-279(+)
MSLVSLLRLSLGIRSLSQLCPRKVKIVEVGPRDGLQNEKVVFNVWSCCQSPYQTFTGWYSVRASLVDKIMNVRRQGLKVSGIVWTGSE